MLFPMALKLEVAWRERMKVIDFEVIRTQMARQAGVSVHQIDEADVRARMSRLYAREEEDASRVYPKEVRPRRQLP